MKAFAKKQIRARYINVVRAVREGRSFTSHAMVSTKSASRQIHLQENYAKAKADCTVRVCAGMRRVRE